jgi:uncharacterized protein with HEPN domain
VFGLRASVRRHRRILFGNVFQFAVIRAVGINGEAVVRLSDTTPSGHPQLPGSEMIGMRNWLAQGY